MESAQAVVAVAELWLWAGALAALAVLPALGRFEPAARGAWAFRPLLIPGFLLLWPLILWRLARRGAEDPRARQRRAGLQAQGRRWRWSRRWR